MMSSRGSRKFENMAIAAFVMVNLAAPWVVGELYPFTVSPMFRDQPAQYCTYKVFDETGAEVDAKKLGLHLVYDGNPPGLGMGIEAEPTMHCFGEVPELEQVASHVRKSVKQTDLNCRSIRVEQRVVSCNGTRPEENVRETKIELQSSQETE